MAHYSNDTGVAPQGVSINDSRRIFNFGERVAELAPQQSPFFVYLSRVAKQATDDPVFKFLEQRHQFQRRNFIVKTDGVATAKDASVTYNVVCDYDKYGNDLKLGGGTSTAAPQFLLVGQVIRVGGKALRITAVDIGAGTSGTYNGADDTTYTEIVCTAVVVLPQSSVNDQVRVITDSFAHSPSATLSEYVASRPVEQLSASSETSPVSIRSVSS